MHRKQLERTFCWKISGELKLFRYQMMQKEKEDIYHAAYQIDGIISIYELLVEMSGMLSKETLEAAVAFPNLLEFLYEEWLGYEDSQAADIQRCLNKELAKLSRMAEIPEAGNRRLGCRGGMRVESLSYCHAGLPGQDHGGNGRD